jgi:hypothetical protein
MSHGGVEGPAAASAYRVPRSTLDGLWAAGEVSEAVRRVTGIVVSMDGADTCTCRIGDDEISGILFRGAPPPVGMAVEIEMRGDLLVIVDDFTVGRENDAEHIVSDADPGLPPTAAVNVGGSFRELDAWEFWGTDLLAWTRDLHESGQGMTLTQVPAAPSTTATLWSETTFEVEPGDVINVSATFAELVPSATVQLMVLWGTVEDGDPSPGEEGTSSVSYGAMVTVAPSATLTTTVTVPAGVDDGAPRTGKIGFRFVGDGDASLVVLSAAVTRSPKGWDLGSLWLDPGAPTPSLSTAAAATVVTAGTGLPMGTLGSWYKVGGIKKVVVSAPPDAGGVVLVQATGSVRLRIGDVPVEFRLVSSSGALLSSQNRITAPAAVTTIPFSLSAMLPLAAGRVDEVALEFRYPDASTGVTHEVWNPTISAVFLGSAVMAGGAAVDAPLRFWDGDNWRPRMVSPAAIDVSKDSTAAPPAKTNTSTKLSWSDLTVHAGQGVTLVATVTPTTSGTVTFERAASAAGPWTVLGSAPTTTGVATKTWEAVAGDWWFRATFNETATHNGSASPVTVPTHVQTLSQRTVTMQATKVQSYNGGGGQTTDTGYNNAVHQGYAGTNRKSMVWFTSTIPANANVTSVTLVCRAGGWAHWENSAGGTVLLGSFRNQATIPSTYPGTKTIEARSRHSVDEGGWSVNISSWANTELERSDWNGLVFGRAPSEAAVYLGRSAQPGENQFSLKVSYDVWV